MSKKEESNNYNNNKRETVLCWPKVGCQSLPSTSVVFRFKLYGLCSRTKGAPLDVNAAFRSFCLAAVFSIAVGASCLLEL